MSQEERDRLFASERERLEVMAQRALDKGYGRYEFVAVCVDPSDPAWSDLTGELAPQGFNAKALQEKGQKPLISGTVESSIKDGLAEDVPSISDALEMEIPVGAAMAIICASGGASVALIRPHHKEN